MKNLILTLIIVCTSTSACTNGTHSNTDINQYISAISNMSDELEKNQHQVMVLGSFHFNRNTDGSDVVASNHTDVTSEENQAIIENIADHIVREFRPTIIAVEWMPRFQNSIDSLLGEYKEGRWKLNKNEAFQIGFRVAQKLNLSTIHAIDNRPKQPESVLCLDDWEGYGDSLGHRELWEEYDSANQKFNNYVDSLIPVLPLDEYLAVLNHPETLRRNKMFWLTGLVNLGHGDKYVGADLTGHWYQRNTRLFVNIRNLCKSDEERVLVIYGQAHKWILYELFEGSPEFEVVQPNFIYRLNEKDQGEVVGL